MIPLRRFCRNFKTVTTDIEFCCFSFGYQHPCTTCPFPDSLHKFLKEEKNRGKTAASFGGAVHNTSKEISEAYQHLGLDPTKSNLTTSELQQAFTRVALLTHPDTASFSNTETKTTKTTSDLDFQTAFESYKILRQYIITIDNTGTK
jgi:hypothetical protein